MNKKKIHSKAPTRIDLCGGTIDIWPLYLFLKAPTTINLAIDLFAEAEIETSVSAGNEFTLHSEDQNLELRLPWSALNQDVQIPPGLALHYKLLRYFFHQGKSSGLSLDTQSFRLSTRAKSPAGAGLGGSSTLSIAMIGALATWLSELKGEQTIDPQRDGEKFIEIVRDVETTVIRVPAGMQDYYGAMFGGLQSLQWGAGSHQRQWFSKDLIAELDSRILLFYSGHSRNSGINNWSLFKDFIDEKGDVRAKFQEISSATESLEKALNQKDFTKAGEAISKEWQVRRTLAAGISTPEIDQAYLEANKITPVSGKVCGAGGGGCFFVYIPLSNPDEREKARSAIRKTLQERGIRPLNFKGVPHGLDVKVLRE